ncbi:MAG TPA: phosphate--AMP phosphotransferase, partial [Acinetobacter radioresistens]|nr:phosphate--AMP phosphotransferase [Acinetobacter radioresistens]
LVERIEGFAKPAEWQRAYDEINRFEKDLTDSQTLVIKFWLAISKDEQAKRFQARADTPHKRFKITDEDWRNREKWDEYLKAAADMFERTSPAWAPWQVIATNNKEAARIQVLEGILKKLQAD